MCDNPTPHFGTDSATVHEQIGISRQHPEIIQACTDYKLRKKCSLLLVTDQGPEDPLHVVRLVDYRRWGFSDTPEHAELLGQLSSSAETLKYDRDRFGMALHKLLLCNSTPFDDTTGIKPIGCFQDACFQLVFDYVPEVFCIVAMQRPALDGKSVALHYAKLAKEVESPINPWRRMMKLSCVRGDV